MLPINKISRRNIFYLLITNLTFLAFKNSIQQVRGQSIELLNNFPTQTATDIKLLAQDEFAQEQIYQYFLELAAGGVEDKPVLLYQGINTSPYKEQIKNYPHRLRLRPNGKTLVDKIIADSTFHPYPAIGQLPDIDEQGLDFLHQDIKEACICIGSFSAGNFQVKWLGRNTLHNSEFLSASKLIPLIYTTTLLNQKLPFANISDYHIQGLDQEKIFRDITFTDLASDLITYQVKLATSNSLGAMFKRFAPQIQLESWLKSITGNSYLVFRGRYGEKPFINFPNLAEPETSKVILSADTDDSGWACNVLSAYDLTRIISMLGWHNYLPKNSRFPFAQKPSLDSIIKIMGTDPARLTDLAIKVLGLENVLDSVVIISKLGNGASISRERTEAVYVALVQFIDRRPQASGKPAKWLTFSMALRGAIALAPRNLDREVVELDARMATEVTKIINRLVL